MTTGHEPKRFSNWTLEIKVWKILAALAILPILVLWFKVVHQDDEILALIRNEVVTDAAGQRTWNGAFVNTNETALRDVGVTVDFLDGQNRTVGNAEAKAVELTFRSRLELQAELPRDAVRLRIHAVQWWMDGRGVRIGAFREPWEFGYLMMDPAVVER